MRRRESIEIIIQILRATATKTGITKTTLVYRSSLSFIRCEKYIGLLIYRNLIEFDRAYPNGPKIFRITQKGREALSVLVNANELVFGKQEVEEDLYAPEPQTEEVIAARTSLSKGTNSFQSSFT